MEIGSPFRTTSLLPSGSGVPSPAIFRTTRSFLTSNPATPSTFQVVFPSTDFTQKIRYIHPLKY
ncbi:MAG: hypothetical protein OXI63_20645 [Candidatus Poribacteria bacterium]|nr:hypothetical protein [Candidatus Poribacteria bacterium]